MMKLDVKEKQAYLITDQIGREHLSGVKLAEGALLYSNKPTYFADARYFSAVKGEIERRGFEAKLYKGLESIKETLKEQRVKALFIDYDTVTLSEYAEYLDLGVKIYDGSVELKRARAIKTDNELNSIKKACEIAQNAIENIVSEIKKGVTENYIKEKLESDMLALGAEGVSFETIVAFGKNSAVPHHQTGETKLEDDMPVLIDMGCKVNGYCSDVTRTFYFGEPSKRFIDCYNAVLDANRKAIEKITDKTLTFEADGFARSLLKERELDKYFTHSLGHGVGLEIHEFPSLSPKKSDELENRMVFTIEPGVYFDGEFGIRIEDTVVLLDGKVNRLYSDDKELKIIK